MLNILSKHDFIDWFLKTKTKQETFNLDIQSEREFVQSIICGLIGLSPFDADNDGTQFILFQNYNTGKKECLTITEDYLSMKNTLNNWLEDMPDTIYILQEEGL